MAQETNALHLPPYDDFVEVISALSLNTSGSGLHGMMCGFLCAGADTQGEAYLRALSDNKKGEAARLALLALFSVYSISQQHISNFDFEFALLLPDDYQPLPERAQAFSEWCEGFIQGLTSAGVGTEQFYEEEAIEALGHISDFADLDFDGLDIDEGDEKAFMEVSEYARMAVLRLHSDLVANQRERDGGEQLN